MANAAISAESKGMSRREFLYYIWGASLALYAAQFTGLLVWFLIPRFREGEFGGKFPLALDAVPPINSAPVNVPDGRFWLVNLDTTDPNDRMFRAPDVESESVGGGAIYSGWSHRGCM
jgi:cytochrome b6-f complex iron-sulfur subunit